MPENSKVLTRTELEKFKRNADNGYGLTCALSPENTLRLVAFIEDHLLPVVRDMADRGIHTGDCNAEQTFGVDRKCICAIGKAKRILSEGGY